MFYLLVEGGTDSTVGIYLIALQLRVSRAHGTFNSRTFTALEETNLLDQPLDLAHCV